MGLTCCTLCCIVAGANDLLGPRAVRRSPLSSSQLVGEGTGMFVHAGRSVEIYRKVHERRVNFPAILYLLRPLPPIDQGEFIFTRESTVGAYACLDACFRWSLSFLHASCNHCTRCAQCLLQMHLHELR